MFGHRSIILIAPVIVVKKDKQWSVCWSTIEIQPLELVQDKVAPDGRYPLWVTYFIAAHTSGRKTWARKFQLQVVGLHLLPIAVM